MDRWVHDEGLFIARNVGSALGVVQVYRCWSLDAPMNDNSFSLLGETSGPSEIAPATVWGQRDYLRLIGFLEVNSVMVNVRGHAILRSLAKSLRVGRADGPETYWRCLDVLPMHTFGLLKPADTHGAPQFLITGGDVLGSVTPSSTIAGPGVWKDKYDKLDVEFRKVKLKVSTLTDLLAVANNDLADSQSEKKNLTKNIESLKSDNKKLDGERQTAIQEADKLTIQVSQLVLQIDLSVRKEADRWAGNASRLILSGLLPNYPDNVHVGVYELSGNGPGLQLSSGYHWVAVFNYIGEWYVYRNGDKVVIGCVALDPVNHTRVRWNSNAIYWENKNKTGQLYCNLNF